MNMNFKFLLIGTSLSLIPTLTNAQCVATTDCATLGYTETSCPDSKGLKCPFGNTFACPATDKSVCEKYGFKYTCSGEGYAGGAGQSCNKQYETCSCAVGYEWKNNKCEKEPGATLGQCTGYAKNCKIGDILNSDGTCSSDKVNGKAPIGVVVYISQDGRCGQAMTPRHVKIIGWGGYGNDIDALDNHESYITAWTDFDSCGNTKKITEYGGREVYGVAWAAVDYMPAGAPSTKGKWCLPAAGVLHNVYENLSAVNSGISKLEGIQFKETTDEAVWSSTEVSAYGAWYFTLQNGPNGVPHAGGLIGNDSKYASSRGECVRPVIEF